MNEEDEFQIIKVVLIGESSVGKTSIICQFMDKIFQEDLQSTVGGTFNSKLIKCSNNKTLKFEIWDTAGQERYRCVTKMFYKDANVVVLVYDITNKMSFEELKNYWIEQVLESSPKNIMLVLAANKSDLIEKEQVDEEEARKYAKTINASFLTVSAKDSVSVGELFKEIAKKYSDSDVVDIIEEDDDAEFKKIRKESIRVSAQPINRKKEKCC